jgi:hypothetical protein
MTGALRDGITVSPLQMLIGLFWHVDCFNMVRQRRAQARVGGGIISIAEALPVRHRSSD